jgi:ribosomal protein S18 acetylase RimI-like enzyme
VSGPGPVDATVWPARDASEDELLERTHHLWKELVRRGEVLPRSWVDEAAHDLKSGELPGLWLPGTTGAPGIVVYSVRADRAFAHAHVDAGAEAMPRAKLLVRSLLGSLPSGVQRADVGLSGLPEADEEAVGRALVEELGGFVVLRRALERPIDPSDGNEVASPIGGARTMPIRALPIGQVAELDWRSFQGTADANLVADTVEEDRRGIEELLAGRLGRFLDEASEAIVTADDRLVGAILISEQDPRHAMVCDIVVEPTDRRRGIARFLMRRSFRALHGLGYGYLRLWVTEANAPARALYKELGFSPVSTARIYRWGTPAGSAPPQPHVER